MTTAGLACRSPAGLRRAGRAVRGAGLAGVSLAGVAAIGAFVPESETYPRPRQDAPPQRRPAAASAPADRIVAAVVLGASGPAGTGALAPCEVCARPPAFFVYTVSAGQAVSVLSGDLVLVPEHSLEDVDSVSEPEPDVVVIPAAAGPAGGELAPLRDWIARHAGRGAHILGECAGSVPLAAAAILVSPRAQRLVGHLAGAPPRPPRPIAEPPVKSFRPSSDGMPLAADAQNTGRRTAP